MVYDYRERIRDIIQNTDNSPRALKASAISINTISDLVLQLYGYHPVEPDKAEPENVGPMPTEPMNNPFDRRNISEPHSFDLPNDGQLPHVISTPESEPDLTSVPPLTLDSDDSFPSEASTEAPKLTLNADLSAQPPVDPANHYTTNYVTKIREIRKVNPELSIDIFCHELDLPRSTYDKIISYPHIPKTGSDTIRKEKDNVAKKYSDIRHVLLDENITSFDETTVIPRLVPDYNALPIDKNARPIILPPANMKIELGHYKTVPDMVDDLVKQTGWSRGDFSEHLGFSATAIYHAVKTNKVRTRSGLIARIAKFLQMPIPELCKHLDELPTSVDHIAPVLVPVKPTVKETAKPLPKAFKQADKKPVIDLKSSIIAEPSKPDFKITSSTNGQELISRLLKAPLKRNEFLAKRNLNGINLINNKGDTVCHLLTTTHKGQEIFTGDLVHANIINKSRAYLMKVEPQNYNLDHIHQLKNCPVERVNGQWQTKGNAKHALASYLAKPIYKIEADYAKRNRFTIYTRIDIAWREQEPEHIVITRVSEQRPASKL